MRTSVEPGTAPRSGAVRFSARKDDALRPVFSRRKAALALCCAVLLGLTAAGCVSTAPRFRSGEKERNPAEMKEPRHAPGLHPGSPREPRPWEDAPLPGALNRDRMLLEIVSFLGVPYAYGGSDRSGVDCSAFTAHVYRSAVRRSLPRSTADQFREGTEVDPGRLRFGDLVFFNTTGETPSHVGIYIEDDLFAHASVSYGVTISSMESPYFKDRFVGARRIVE